MPDNWTSMGDASKEALRLVQPEADSTGDSTGDSTETDPAEELMWLERAGVPLRFRQLLIDPALAPDECRQWLNHCLEGAGMILSGPPGTGKTVAAVYCLRIMYRHPRRREADFGGCMFVTAHNLYQAVFNKDHDVLRRARDVQALVIDDWGLAYEHQWPLTEMDAILNARWAELRATILTTNTHPSKGEGSIKELVPRAYDRLCDLPGPGVALINRASMRGGGR